jgi:Nucleolar protein 12 (25kDa)
MLSRVGGAGSGESQELNWNFSRDSQKFGQQSQGLVEIAFTTESMPPPAKRRKPDSVAVEEITFDPTARQDYLTGFHKRKLQRAKHAQEIAEKKARAERIKERRKVNMLDDGMIWRSLTWCIATGGEEKRS